MCCDCFDKNDNKTNVILISSDDLISNNLNKQ